MGEEYQNNNGFNQDENFFRENNFHGDNQEVYPNYNEKIASYEDLFSEQNTNESDYNDYQHSEVVQVSENYGFESEKSDEHSETVEVSKDYVFESENSNEQTKSYEDVNYTNQQSHQEPKQTQNQNNQYYHQQMKPGDYSQQAMYQNNNQYAQNGQNGYSQNQYYQQRDQYNQNYQQNNNSQYNQQGSSYYPNNNAQYYQQPSSQSSYNHPSFAEQKSETIPQEYKPVSILGFIGYSILFAIPGLGFILSIIFSFIPKKKSAKNFARAYLIVSIVALLAAVVLGYTFKESIISFIEVFDEVLYQLGL